MNLYIVSTDYIETIVFPYSRAHIYSSIHADVLIKFYYCTLALVVFTQLIFRYGVDVFIKVIFCLHIIFTNRR